MPILKLAIKSIANRRFSALLTILSVAISVSLLLGVEKIRIAAKTSFINTISSTDLIVGARSGSVNLLLYSVFRMGQATNNVSWNSYQHLSQHSAVKWSVPLSLGDSHQSYPVLGTNNDYFKFYRYGEKMPLQFEQGTNFTKIYGAVIGADVAKQLHYQLGQSITLTHGTGKANLHQHDDNPFHVIGILEKTSTPVDRTIHIPLAGMEAIHANWSHTASSKHSPITLNLDSEPKQITAFLLGLKSKTRLFAMQRHINNYAEEPLMAVIPGVALQQLWRLTNVIEYTLLIISGFVLLTGLLGMLTAILSTLNERRREMAILRSVGARPRHIFLLFISEAGLLASMGIVFGTALLYLLLFTGQPIISQQFGIQLPITWLSINETTILLIIMTAGLIIGSIPAIMAYRRSLADGMTPHL